MRSQSRVSSGHIRDLKTAPRIVMATTVHPHDDVRIYHKEAKALAKAGAAVSIVNLRYAGKDTEGITFIKACEQPEVRFARMTLGVGAVLRGVLRLRPQVCHLHDPELLPIVPLLRSRGIKVIYDAHEKLSDQMLTKPWIPKGLRAVSSGVCGAVERGFCNGCDGIIAATEEIARSFKGAVVLKNLPTLRDYNLINAALQSEKQKPYACYIGAITEQRGIFTIIQAAYQAGVPLRLAGRFESRALYQRAQRMKEWENVRYMGVLDREGVAKLMASCSVGLLLLEDTPSYRLSLPIKLYEYLAAGLRVVASDFPYWRSLGLEGSIRFVSPDDPAAIAEAITAACKAMEQCCDRAERARVFQQGHHFAEETLLTLYKKLLTSDKKER